MGAAAAVENVDPGKSNLEVRCIGGLAGLYVLSSRERAKSRLQTFACRTHALTPHSITVSAPVLGAVGEPVSARFSKIGLVHGEIQRRTFAGFEMSVDLKEADRAAFASKLRWLKNAVNTGVPDNREHARFAPPNPHSSLILSDGQVIPCFVIDISASGASLSADCDPELKTPLAVGRVVGRVVRKFEGGFAIQFIDKQDMNEVDDLLSSVDNNVVLD